MVVTSIAKPTWLLFAIYSSPWFAERRLLWENLESVVNLHSMPWVITGDFNEVLMGDDKLGGSPINISRALQFQECLDTCRMIDIGFSLDTTGPIANPSISWFKKGLIEFL